MVSSGDGGCISSESIHVAPGSIFSAGMDLIVSRQAADPGLGDGDISWSRLSTCDGKPRERPREPRLLSQCVQWLILSVQKPF